MEPNFDWMPYGDDERYEPDEEQPSGIETAFYRGIGEAKKPPMLLENNSVTARVPPVFDGTNDWWQYENTVRMWEQLSDLTAEKERHCPEGQVRRPSLTISIIWIL